MNSKEIREGFRDGIPIALGYFAVAVALGIMARGAGINWFQGFIASLTTYASAGQYAGFMVIADGGTYMEMAIMTIVASGRYLLMSCAMSQRLSPELPFYHRILMGFGITDELFGISIARTGYVNPLYTYTAAAIAIPSWALGTALGIIAGNILPARIVSALSVALYGMFIAVFIPAAKKDRTVGIVVIISCMLSSLTELIPFLSALSAGTKIIILTVVISAVAAVIWPVDEEDDQNPEQENLSAADVSESEAASGKEAE